MRIYRLIAHSSVGMLTGGSVLFLLLPQNPSLGKIWGDFFRSRPPANPKRMLTSTQRHGNDTTNVTNTRERGKNVYWKNVRCTPSCGHGGRESNRRREQKHKKYIILDMKCLVEPSFGALL